MLRTLVLLLLLANAGFWAWSAGWLAPLHGFIGAAPDGEREPQRLARQLRPELVRVVSAAADTPAPVAAARVAAAPPAGSCLEAGPFTPAELAAAQAALQTALPGGWVVRELAPGGGWWVAMGPYHEAEPLARKREELQRRNIEPEPAASAAGGGSLLVLSRHDARDGAERALAALAERGVRSARVLEGPPVPLHALRVVQADAAQQALLAALPPERLRGKSFSACPNG